MATRAIWAPPFDFQPELVVVNWGQVYVAPRSHPLAAGPHGPDAGGPAVATLYYESLKRTQDILKVFPTFVEVDSYRETLRSLSRGARAEAALVPRIFGAYHERLFAVEKRPPSCSVPPSCASPPRMGAGPPASTLDRELGA